MTMQSTEEKKEVFPGVYTGDLVVSLRNMSNHRQEGDIIEVLDCSSRNALYYWSAVGPDRGDVNSSEFKSFRKATPEEAEWYKSTKKEKHVHPNIKDMPKINNHYQIF